MSATFTNVQRVRILYKTIIKLHRGLPGELNVIGTSYVRDEFKRHKKCTSQEAEVFISEWTNYAINLAKQLGLRGPKTGTSRLGENLSENHIENMRDEQIYQLYELMQAAQEMENNNVEKK